MYIARLLYPVTVLGPGERIGLWLAGCRRACKGCSNPELWEQRPEQYLATDDVMRLVEKVAHSHPVDGFTISGGDPFDQAEALAALLPALAAISGDILIYTGYTMADLRSEPSGHVKKVLNRAAVVIDGPYIEALNDNTCLRGSSNQGIHILNPDYRQKYDAYLNNATNRIQNFTTADGVVSVGIHRKTF